MMSLDSVRLEQFHCNHGSGVHRQMQQCLRSGLRILETFDDDRLRRAGLYRQPVSIAQLPFHRRTDRDRWVALANRCAKIREISLGVGGGGEARPASANK